MPENGLGNRGIRTRGAEGRPSKLPARLAVGLGLGSGLRYGHPLAAPRLHRRIARPRALTMKSSVPPRHCIGYGNDFGCAMNQGEDLPRNARLVELWRVFVSSPEHLHVESEV